jgi:hypothetical protein
LIHETCMKNPKCMGFRIKNDESSGDILQVYTGDQRDFPALIKCSNCCSWC